MSLVMKIVIVLFLYSLYIAILLEEIPTVSIPIILVPIEPIAVFESSKYFDKFIAPNRQAPPFGRGNSPHGFVASYSKLGSSPSKQYLLIVSQYNIPGSENSHAVFAIRFIISSGFTHFSIVSPVAALLKCNLHVFGSPSDLGPSFKVWKNLSLIFTDILAPVVRFKFDLCVINSSRSG